MTFELSEEHEAFRKVVRDFAEREVGPYVAQWDREHHFPVDVVADSAPEPQPVPNFRRARAYAAGSALPHPASASKSGAALARECRMQAADRRQA